MADLFEILLKELNITHEIQNVNQEKLFIVRAINGKVFVVFNKYGKYIRLEVIQK